MFKIQSMNFFTLEFRLSIFPLSVVTSTTECHNSYQEEGNCYFLAFHIIGII